MPFQVHSELVKVAELSFPSETTSIPRAGQFRIPQQPTSALLDLESHSAQQTQRCLRDYHSRARTECARQLALNAVCSFAGGQLQTVFSHGSTQCPCRAAAV